MTYRERIITRLNEAFRPASLDVIDESHLHHGHSGWKDGGETHFRVRIVADTFRGTTRLGRHRAINDALSAELAERVHALAIDASAPED